MASADLEIAEPPARRRADGEGGQEPTERLVERVAVGVLDLTRGGAMIHGDGGNAATAAGRDEHDRAVLSCQRKLLLELGGAHGIVEVPAEEQDGVGAVVA